MQKVFVVLHLFLAVEEHERCQRNDNLRQDVLCGPIAGSAERSFVCLISSEEAQSLTRTDQPVLRYNKIRHQHKRWCRMRYHTRKMRHRHCYHHRRHIYRCNYTGQCCRRHPRGGPIKCILPTYSNRLFDGWGENSFVFR